MRSIFLLSGLLLLSACLWIQCLVTETAFPKVAPGTWRGVLELDKTFFPVKDKDSIFVLHDQFKPGELPFNFEVIYTDADHFYIEIINGSERIRCDSIAYGRDKTTARDTFNLFFPEYQSYIHTDVRGAAMQGEWIVTSKDNYRIPFYAQAGKDYRFTNLNRQPEGDLSGEWAVWFGIESNSPEKAIGEFRQEGNHLSGTFRTETGDYRFLEGTIQGSKFWLSTFDGSHAFLFSGSIKGDSIQGEFRSGKHFRTLWTGWKDRNFKLGDPDTLTSLNPNIPFTFSLKTPDGNTLRYPSDEFKGKVKIFTIMGTWCPNCMDEQQFLLSFLKENPQLGRHLKITGLAFEKHKDEQLANIHLTNFTKRKGLPYDLVYAGPADKEIATSMFPALSGIMAFPTMIIADKNDQIRKIHTGFDGPATSQYESFKSEFASLIQQLCQE